MAKLNKVLVIGGGISGMSAAICLRKQGIAVDLVELNKNWDVQGAGITVSGPTLRAFKEVGVIDRILEQGGCTDGLYLCDANGNRVGEIPTPRIAGPDIPGGGGLMRPVLAKILSDATLEAGTSVRLGVTFTAINQDAKGVNVEFSDGSRDTYDLVIGADGLWSKVRPLIFPDAAKPKYTEQGSWRAVVPRPAEIDRCNIFMNANIKAGVNPVSRDEMYLFLLEHRPENNHLDPSEWHIELRRLLAGFGGVVGKIRDSLNPDSRILYRPLESLLLTPPWHSGRILLIGDAAHATTPHLASGAGIGVEDAIVLADELACAVDKDRPLGEALDNFTQRRFERCRLVVQNSLRLGEIEISAGSKEEHSQIMRDSIIALLAPI
jgi:2-polyprenyl-6-methoxyphenol hydroxylase-like FAD-dependent oxidoreductase